MPLRYTDLSPEINGVSDFVSRKRKPSLLQLSAITLATILVVMLMTLGISERSTLLTALVFLVLVVGWYVIMHTQRGRDLVLATEFQNALFASALGLNNKFTIIMKRDGYIVYIDRAFQELFPEFMRQPRRSIDVLFEYGRVSSADSEKIYSALERGVYDKVIFDIRASGHITFRMILTIEPILRPSGFVLLRGREYVEKRSAKNVPADVGVLNKSNITLFAHVMDSMDMGIYMTSPTGALVYVNPVLERWLDFNEGEMTSENLSLPDIIHQEGGSSDTVEPDNFKGEVLMKRKNGGMTRCFVNQKLIHGEQNKILGCTALVHTIAEPKNDDKKKLW